MVVNYRSSAEQAQTGGLRPSMRKAVRRWRFGPTSPMADDVDAMIKEDNERWGSVDALVHNALIPFDVTSFADVSWDQLGGKLDAELRAAFLITKAVVPGMISRNYGRLVYLSTGLSRRPREGMINLGIAKAALDQFVRYVALELAPHGITANLVAPATVDETKVTEQLTADQVRRLGTTNSHGTPRPPRRGGAHDRLLDQ